MSWNSLIIVAYQPHFSNEVKEHLRDNLSPSMDESNPDGDSTHQYHIDAVNEELAHGIQLSEQDLAILEQAKLNNVEYFEF